MSRINPRPAWVAPLALGALIAGLVFVSSASAIHRSPTGGSPIRVPLVLAMLECPAGGAIAGNHGGPYPVAASCPTGDNNSMTATLGVSALGPSPRVGHLRVIVCPAAGAPGCGPLGAFPDVRFFGNLSDVVCKGPAPPGICPGGPGSDYDPVPAPPFYGAGLVPGTNSNTTPPTPLCGPGAPPPGCFSGADMTATALIPLSTSPVGPPPAGPALRITDHFNAAPAGGNPTPTPPEPPACGATVTCTGTVVDGPFTVPVVCAANAAAIGSYCGTNTTANALIPGVVVPGSAANIRIGEIQLYDAGPDGIPGMPAPAPDDQLFATQGIFIP
jgi:hypothetical protein